MLSLPTQHKRIYFPNLAQLKDLSPLMQLKPKKGAIAINTPLIKILPLAIEVFGCLHKHADVFLHDCANAIWSFKGTEGPHFSTLVTFFCQKVSITLQWMQVSSILSWVVVVRLTIFRLPPLQDTPPITMIDLLQAIEFQHRNMADLPQVVSYGHGEIFTTILSQLDVLSPFPFSLFYSFVHFPNLWCVS
jgi:hypothetical protein